MLVRAAKLLAKIARRERGRFVIDAVTGAQQQEDGSVVSPTSLYTFDPEFDYRSDSIILWSIFDRARIFHFCDACVDFFCDVLEQRIPLRGGIAVGVGYMDKESGIYVGQPLAEAVRVETAQAWIGVSPSVPPSRPRPTGAPYFLSTCSSSPLTESRVTRGYRARYSIGRAGGALAMAPHHWELSEK